jgi:hypothetical protein
MLPGPAKLSFQVNGKRVGNGENVSIASNIYLIYLFCLIIVGV